VLRNGMEYLNALEWREHRGATADALVNNELTILTDTLEAGSTDGG
jgi:hypothetical protein